MKQLGCILLVDDNSNDNYYHHAVIRDAAACSKVEIVRDGSGALEYIEKSKSNAENYPCPDLIFLDLHMPGMDGFSFLDRLKETGDNNGYQPVIVVMTGSLFTENEQVVREKYAAQITAFVHKPLTRPILETIIHKFL